MSESQYAHYQYLPRESLGIMVNQLWRDDPKMVGIHLARYKFVAKMLAGKQHVAEIGCGDGWFSKIVRQAVGTLHLYDFDPIHAQEANAICFNILSGPIQYWQSASVFNSPPQRYEAIYSLDVMEHIHPKDERIYLENIKASLLPEGVFIAGMPSLESQEYASKASRAGHKNCQSGEELRTTLQKHFHNVFMFGMSDESIHTGFLPMCHYLLAVAVGVKNG